MVHITSEELKTLARAARLTLPHDAQERLVNKLEAVLSYAELLGNVVQQDCNPLPEARKETPVRNDIPLPSIPDKILSLAPQIEDHYLVVPVIITSNT